MPYPEQDYMFLPLLYRPYRLGQGIFTDSINDKDTNGSCESTEKEASPSWQGRAKNYGNT